MQSLGDQVYFGPRRTGSFHNPKVALCVLAKPNAHSQPVGLRAAAASRQGIAKPDDPPGPVRLILSEQDTEKFATHGRPMSMKGVCRWPTADTDRAAARMHFVLERLHCAGVPVPVHHRPPSYPLLELALAGTQTRSQASICPWRSAGRSRPQTWPGNRRLARPGRRSDLARCKNIPR